MEEIWKDVKDFEGLYQISNLGRIKSLPRKRKNGATSFCMVKERILTIQINKHRHGYCEISLHKNGAEKRFRVNRLVALHFISNPENKPEVNHIDGDKLNNRVDNLEWTTSIENKQHAWNNGLCTSEHRKRKIICNETNEVFDSVVECSVKLNVDRRSIFRVFKGERKTCGGFTFSYINE